MFRKLSPLLWCDEECGGPRLGLTKICVFKDMAVARVLEDLQGANSFYKRLPAGDKSCINNLLSFKYYLIHKSNLILIK